MLKTKQSLIYLHKLSRYVWCHLEIGYMQGIQKFNVFKKNSSYNINETLCKKILLIYFLSIIQICIKILGMCDLAAPLLVVFEDEALTYSCFTEVKF